MLPKKRGGVSYGREGAYFHTHRNSLAAGADFGSRGETKDPASWGTKTDWRANEEDPHGKKKKNEHLS